MAFFILFNFSLIILTMFLIVIIIKQLELRCTAVYFLIMIIVSIIGWIVGDMLQIIFSSLENKELVLLFSRIATISSMIAMISTVLFARVLTARQTLNSTIVIIAFMLFSAVVALTLSSSYKVIDPPKDVEFYKTEAELLWVIFDGVLVIFAGSVFLYYLIRQRKIVQKRYLPVLTLMSVGVIIAFFVSTILYTIYAIWFIVPLLHLELVSASLGAIIIGIAMIKGGKEAIYYSSRVFSLHIFDEVGISYYASVFQAGYIVDEQLISGVASAIISFAKELIGKEVFPREIDLDDYSLLLAKKDNIIILISVEYPTAHLRQTMNNIIEKFSMDMSEEEIGNLVENYICFEPRKLVH